MAKYWWIKEHDNDVRICWTYRIGRLKYCNDLLKNIFDATIFVHFAQCVARLNAAICAVVIVCNFTLQKLCLLLLLIYDSILFKNNKETPQGGPNIESETASNDIDLIPTPFTIRFHLFEQAWISIKNLHEAWKMYTTQFIHRKISSNNVFFNTFQTQKCQCLQICY